MDQLEYTKTQLTDLQNSNKDLTWENEIILAQLQESKIKIENILKQYGEFKASLNEVNSQLAQDIFTTKKKNKRQSEEIERLKHEMNTKREIIIHYQAQIQSLSDSLAQKDGEFEEVKKQDSLKHEIIDDKSAQLVEMKNVISSLKESAAKLEAEKKVYEEESTALRSKCEDLERQHSEYVSETTAIIEKIIRDFKSQKTTMKSDYEKIRDEYENRFGLIQKEIDEEREAVKALKSENDRLTAEKKHSEEVKKELSIEIKFIKSQLETVTATQSGLIDDRIRLLNELKAYHREFADLQAKFCEAISEKENMLKEIVELSKRQYSSKVEAEKQIEFQMKLEEKLDQLQTRLDKTKRMSGQFKGPGIGLHTNESFMVKLDNQIDTQLQNKVRFDLNTYL
jgi:chromosome segregation ATPase